MSQASLQQLTVIDLVPFGNPGGQTAFFALRLTSPTWESWQPGQFVMIRPLQGGSELLWGRPFAICRVTKSDMVLFFQVRGRGTSALARLVPGDVLNVWGPLGNAFVVEPQTPTLILAGGIGIAPFVGYVQAHPTPWDITMEFGHRLPLDCYPVDSINERALVEAHLEESQDDRLAFLDKIDQRIQNHAEKGLVLACGPTPFLREIQRMSLKYNARTQICLETRMACGVGACLGCVVKTTGKGNFADATSTASGVNVVQTCTCGPNFWADSVNF